MAQCLSSRVIPRELAQAQSPLAAPSDVTFSSPSSILCSLAIVVVVVVLAAEASVRGREKARQREIFAAAAATATATASAAAPNQINSEGKKILLPMLVGVVAGVAGVVGVVIVVVGVVKFSRSLASFSQPANLTNNILYIETSAVAPR